MNAPAAFAVTGLGLPKPLVKSDVELNVTVVGIVVAAVWPLMVNPVMMWFTDVTLMNGVST